MLIEGRIIKDGRWWVVDIPALRAMTQGATKREAYEMADDIVDVIRNDVGMENLEYAVVKVKGETFYIDIPDSAGAAALILKRQRRKSGLSVRKAAANMGSSSPRAISGYESGARAPGIEKFEELLDAAAPGKRLVISVVD